MRKFLEFLEKRLHPRYCVEAPVLFEILDADSMQPVVGSRKATLLDIGRKGCSLVVDRVMFNGFYLLGCLEEKRAYRVRLTMGIDRADTPADLMGRIAWIDNITIGNERRFRIGIELDSSLKTSDFSRLRRLLEEGKKQEGEICCSL